MKSRYVRQAFFAGLATALLSTTALTAISSVAVRPAYADEASELASINAFFDFGYGVCDAEVLSKFWGIDFWEAKVIGGEKVQAGAHDVLSEVLSQAYGSHVCGETSALDYHDAGDIAALWMGQTEA